MWERPPRMRNHLQNPDQIAYAWWMGCEIDFKWFNYHYYKRIFHKVMKDHRQATCLRSSCLCACVCAYVCVRVHASLCMLVSLLQWVSPVDFCLVCTLTAMAPGWQAWVYKTLSAVILRGQSLRWQCTCWSWDRQTDSLLPLRVHYEERGSSILPRMHCCLPVVSQGRWQGCGVVGRQWLSFFFLHSLLSLSFSLHKALLSASCCHDNQYNSSHQSKTAVAWC